MSSQCSLYCSLNYPEQILITAESLLSSSQIELFGEIADWQAFRVIQDEIQLEVQRMTISDLGESFAELIHNTCSLVKGIDTRFTEQQDSLITHLSQTVQVLAFEVKGSSEFGFDEISEELLFKTAELVNAVIFTGNEFLNREGGLVLDLQGDSHENLI